MHPAAPWALLLLPGQHCPDPSCTLHANPAEPRPSLPFSLSSSPVMPDSASVEPHQLAHLPRRMASSAAMKKVLSPTCRRCGGGDEEAACRRKHTMWQR